MKKAKNRSRVPAVPEVPAVSVAFMNALELDASPLDTLVVNIQSLRVIDEEPRLFSIKVTFFDQLLLKGVIMAIGSRAVVKERTVLTGTMTYDPSDYERMCFMADHPLCAQIRPQKVDSNLTSSTPLTDSTASSKSKLDSFRRNIEDISCCNIDILSLFIDENNKYVQKRMEPLIKPSILSCKSYDNLPIISMKIKIIRNKHNECHHKILKRANIMKMTLVSSHNMPVPYEDAFVYTAASKLPLQNGDAFGIVTFNQGYRVPKHFNSLKFYPKWESLRVGDENFAQGDFKFECSIMDIQNDYEIPLRRYIDHKLYTTVWGSFHRTLLLGNLDSMLMSHISRYEWPLEIHMYGEKSGYSFMAFLNLFRLLYPGEKRVRIAVPLRWINAEAMQQRCECDLLLTPNEKALFVAAPTQKTTNSPSSRSPPNVDTELVQPTGHDGNEAFVIVEVKLARPLKKAVIPPFISDEEVNSMLCEMEQAEPHKRGCTGRGQQDRDWHSTVRLAASALRKVPYYGLMEFCNFSRQLSETRTRVELMTSFWQDAAVYINNNFVVQDFLKSDETFEEMLMMGHASLIKTAGMALVGVDRPNIDPILRAARYARQMQDIPHAVELYLQLIGNKPRDATFWRELSTCLKDIDRDQANVCINESLVLDPRNPLSLLSKSGMLFEEDPALAEPFFIALLALHPFWYTGWIAASAYYFKRELFHMADRIKDYYDSQNKILTSEDVGSSRTWERELGDWWDSTPILPGMSPYYDAADICLRLRAVALAEVCISLALHESGETAAYFHLLALCCRLKGDLDNALCHIHSGIEKYGEITYLKSLEAECYHKQNNSEAAAAAFEKTGSCVGGFSILLSIPYLERHRARAALVDLVRRQPSAYAWMAFADDWMMRDEAGECSGDGTGEQIPAKTCASMCAVQALKVDQQMRRAWVLLARLVKPSSRRQHCLEMARACGFVATSESCEKIDTDAESQQSHCYYFGDAVVKCNAFI